MISVLGILIRFVLQYFHIFNHYSDYLEDMRERKVETNSEAQKLIDEIQKFTTSYMNTIQSHCDKLIEKVQKNRALKIQKVEEVISEIEQLENETESTLDIRFVLRARSWILKSRKPWTILHTLTFGNFRISVCLILVQNL